MIVYAGAIMVLFIFVLMLLNAEEEIKIDKTKIAVRMGYPLLAMLLIEVVSVLRTKFPGDVLVSFRPDVRRQHARDQASSMSASSYCRLK